MGSDGVAPVRDVRSGAASSPSVVAPCFRRDSAACDGPGGHAVGSILELIPAHAAPQSPARGSSSRGPCERFGKGRRAVGFAVREEDLLRVGRAARANGGDRCGRHGRKGRRRCRSPPATGTSCPWMRSRLRAVLQAPAARAVGHVATQDDGRLLVGKAPLQVVQNPSAGHHAARRDDHALAL